MYTLKHLPGRTVNINNEEWLYFSGTAYLGISRHSDFELALLEGFQRYGTNFGSSRRSNMQLAIFEEAENYLANWIGTESALTVSSGTLAGQLINRLILLKQYKLFIAPDTHPALLNNHKPFVGNREQWIQWLTEKANFEDTTPNVLLTNALNPLWGKVHNWDWLKQLPKDKSFWLVLDDSHGFGIVGEQGNGTLQQLPKLSNLEYIVVGSLGKAPGIPAGIIAGSKFIIEELWKKPFFGGASPAIPAYLYAFLQTAELRQLQLHTLQRNINLFTGGDFPMDHFHYSPQYPVFRTTESNLNAYLKNHKILISAFPYPGPSGPIISRVIINALHREEDIIRLMDMLKHFKDYGRISPRF